MDTKTPDATNANPTDHTKIEQEVVVLTAVWEIIGEMVNKDMFMPLEKKTEVVLMPRTSAHKRVFNILLVDFLTDLDTGSFGLEKAPTGSKRTDRTYLYYLTQIAKNPQFNPERFDLIQKPVDEFIKWLEGECLVEKVWFPSVSIETDLKVKRIEFLLICGNIAKHSFASLSWNAKEIRSILKRNGVDISKDEKFLVLQEFYDWFHNNILGYHLSAIAEFLNNIQWGIHDYLKPEFVRSLKRDASNPEYHAYDIPAGIDRDVFKTLYWELMNNISSEPYVQRFEVWKYLKMRY